jgi:Spy/CpxP family protein refolding chaperone
MMSTRRAQMIGGALLCLAFVAGVLSGAAWTRSLRSGVNVDVRLTTDLPRELRRLNLTATQADTLRRILGAGHARTVAVLHELEPRMRGVMDTVTAQIREVLTPTQRAQFDAARHRSTRNVIERIDTVSR